MFDLILKGSDENNGDEGSKDGPVDEKERERAAMIGDEGDNEEDEEEEDEEEEDDEEGKKYYDLI